MRSSIPSTLHRVATIATNMSTAPTFTLGKSIIQVVNLNTLIGPFLADWKCNSPTICKINRTG